MTTADMIATARKIAESQPGYAYNPQTLAAVIEAGEVPDGATVMVMGEQVAKLEGAEVVTYVDGKVTRRTPASPDRSRELVGYAVMQSRLSTQAGSLS
jgi:hypothetical protein